jgi:membrane glycosyltransferase
MNMLSSHQAAADAAGPLAGLPMRSRRLLFATAVGATITAAIALMIKALSPGGFGWLDFAVTACFALTLPWTAIGFWNALAGFMLMRTASDPATAVCPPLANVDDRAPITARTAILSCIRNEDVDIVGRNLDLIVDDLIGTGDGHLFDVFVLSDSDWPEIIAEEEVRVAALAERWRGRIEVSYRRRRDNAGFKAGNIRDFCLSHAADYDFMLVLDADSLMSADTITRMVRVMQATPDLGILQTLMVGLPTASAFARPFQFGMRLGMKSYSLGSAWWQGDAGPYWGHNALIRSAPFTAHCELPELPGRGPLAGWVLSHDQVEAALMRRAGYGVRVMPVENGSWEENPTTLTEFIRRDLRWCQGNLQYLKLRGMNGLHPISRVHLGLAVLMFVSSPAWVALMTLGTLRTGFDDGPIYEPVSGQMLLILVLTMIFAPKLATLADLLMSPMKRRRFGGGGRLLTGTAAEITFSTLMAPIMAIAHTVFMAGLLFGRAVVWGPQRRAVHRIGVGQALRRLWPQTLVGVAAAGWLAAYGAGGAIFFSPFFAGALLAAPIAVLTALPSLGLALARIGLWRTPDEIDPAAPLAALHLPRMAGSSAAPRAYGGLGDTAVETAE